MAFTCEKEFSIQIAASGGFWNTEQSYTAQCVLPLHGPDKTVTVPAHTFHSDVSQAAADAAAQASAQSSAEAQIVCCAEPNEIGVLVWTENNTLQNGAVENNSFSGATGTIDVDAHWPGFGPIPGAQCIIETNWCSPWTSYAAQMDIHYEIDSTLGGFLSTVSITIEINGDSFSDSCPVQFPPCSKVNDHTLNGTITKCVAGNPAANCNTMRVTIICIGGTITGTVTITPVVHP